MKTRMPGVIGAKALAATLERDSSVRLLDVRTVAEFGHGHVQGAYNVPLDRLAGHAGDIRQVREPVVLVCRSGARARAAEQQLRQAGMRNLHLLEGGMLAWRGEGLPVQGRPSSTWERLGRAAGAGFVVLAVLYATTSPLTAVLLAFFGLRMALGQPLLPCAATGTCTVPGDDTQAHVRAFVEGRAVDAGPEAPGHPAS